MSVAQKIEEKLNLAFNPEKLVVIDESHLHAGHAGARPQGESHFRVEIVSDSFSGLSRVARQRAIYQVLANEMATDVHALALDVKAPG
jgi:BolA protein